MRTQNISHWDKRENARTLVTSDNYEIPHGAFSKLSSPSAVILNPSYSAPEMGLGVIGNPLRNHSPPWWSSVKRGVELRPSCLAL